MSRARRRLQEATSRYMQEREVYDKIQKRRRRGLYRRLVVYCILTFILAGTFFSIFLSQNKLLNEKLEEKEAAEQELKKVNAEQIDLREEIKKLNDYEYVGEIARRDFFFSKKGETIFKLPPESETN